MFNPMKFRNLLIFVFVLFRMLM